MVMKRGSSVECAGPTRIPPAEPIASLRPLGTLSEPSCLPQLLPFVLVPGRVRKVTNVGAGRVGCAASSLISFHAHGATAFSAGQRRHRSRRHGRAAAGARGCGPGRRAPAGGAAPYDPGGHRPLSPAAGVGPSAERRGVAAPARVQRAAEVQLQGASGARATLREAGGDVPNVLLGIRSRRTIGGGKERAGRHGEGAGRSRCARNEG